VTNRNERSIGGLAGRLVGKAKEVLASATANDEVAREGLRTPQSDSQHQRPENEVAAAQREQRIERDRVEAAAAAAAAAAAEAAGTGSSGPASADAGGRAQYTGAERSVRAAERVRLAATEEANRLEREAREAQRRAEHLDPKEDK
jgi:hypothetical protein